LKALIESEEMTNEPNKIIDKAVGELYRGFYHLRQQRQYKEEYDSMGALINMLMQDREYLRKMYLAYDDI
jgi:hypothetical protein